LSSQPDILQYGEREKDVGELERPPNTQLSPSAWRERRDVPFFKKDLSLSRAVLPGNHIKKGRFPCAIRANNRFECERRDLKSDMIYRYMTAESNGKVPGLNDRVWVHTVRKSALKPYNKWID
jgi:hypothetical protein